MPAATMRATNSSGWMVRDPAFTVSMKDAAEYCSPTLAGQTCCLTLLLKGTRDPSPSMPHGPNTCLTSRLILNSTATLELLQLYRTALSDAQWRVTAAVMNTRLQPQTLRFSAFRVREMGPKWAAPAG